MRKIHTSRRTVLGWALAVRHAGGNNVKYYLRSVDAVNLAPHRLFESYNFTGEIVSQVRSI